MRHLDGWFDGACEPRNPGGHSVCALIWKDGAERMGQKAGSLGTHPSNTNNDAEYRAALNALRWLIAFRRIRPGDPWTATLHGDSQLVVRQVNGEYACNVERLRVLRDAMRAEIAALSDLGVAVTLRWVPREENQEADALGKALYSDRERAEIVRVEAWRKAQKAKP